MTTAGSYNFHESHRDPKAEIERLAAQARLGWDKAARTLSAFGLQDGMSILELGSGPGFITEALLALVPHSPITCLDVNSELLLQAEGYLTPAAKDRVRFIQGSVMNLPFEEARFDFAYARYLFQHLPDPLGAAKETWRVLKPGGRFVIHDIDDDLFGIIDPPIPEIPSIIEMFGKAQAARGGNRRIGRELWRILKAAGFDNLQLQVLAAHSDEEGLELFLPIIDPDRFLPLVKTGSMSAQVVENLRVSREGFLASAEPYMLLLALMGSGQKPHAET